MHQYLAETPAGSVVQVRVEAESMEEAAVLANIAFQEWADGAQDTDVIELLGETYIDEEIEVREIIDMDTSETYGEPKLVTVREGIVTGIGV